MTTSFFIDESGHNGDLMKTGEAYNFLDRPYFALACIGLEDEQRLTHLVNELKLRHRVPLGELKSKGLGSKPAFVAELIETVLNKGLPIFVEVVDKRYFVCIQLVICQLLSPLLGYGHDPKSDLLRNMLLDFLYDHVVGPCPRPVRRLVYWLIALFVDERVRQPVPIRAGTPVERRSDRGIWTYRRTDGTRRHRGV